MHYMLSYPLLVILHQGRLQQIGTVVEIWNRPANRFVAYFVGEPAMNFIPGEVENLHSVFILTSEGKRIFTFKGDVDPKYVGTEITIGVRPQQIKVYRKARQENAIPGSVRIIEFQGDKTVLTVILADKVSSDVKAVVSAEEKYNEGETVWLYFAPDIIHLFDGDVPILKKENL